jgi:hypothetical protein
MLCVFKRHHVGHSDELQIYLSLPQVDDPLEWWKNNQQQFSNLSQMACNYLAILASSVPCEQVFFAGKNLITDKRN